MPNFDDIRIGDELPEQYRETSIVQQFLYNAALWNPHRIHFDARWTREVEGYPELVVAGPLMGDWLTQLVLAWLGSDGRLASIEYSNRGIAWVGETLAVSGRIETLDPETRSAELALAVRNEEGELLVPATATVIFPGETAE